MNGKGLFAVAAAVLAAGCATGAPMQPVVPEIIYPQPEQQSAGRYPARAEVLEFQHYGRQIADRVSSDPNFGGFIFKSEPEPHAIVMFTGDAEPRLRRYTSDPRFRAKRVDITLADLERMKDRVSAEMRVPGVECAGVDADEEHNTVTISAPPHELEMIRAAIREGRFRPPPKFRLVAGSCIVPRTLQRF